MGSYYGDTMLLKELMEATNVNLSLSDEAQNIEIHDDFKNNPSVSINDIEITILCSVDDVNRAINFNFDKNTITEIFTSDLGIGGEVYSMNGLLLKIIN
jgi:hypothetical protein